MIKLFENDVPLILKYALVPLKSLVPANLQTARCSGIIFITIDAWHHSETAILKLCARAARNLACVPNFNIAYSTLH